MNIQSAQATTRRITKLLEQMATETNADTLAVMQADLNILVATLHQTVKA